MMFSSCDIPDQSGRVAIVTGGNSGIGLETARALAEKGARVVVASRDAQKSARARADILRTVPDGRVEVLSLNLANLESVRDFAREFGRKYERLDVLINNAGVMFPPFQKTAQGFELTFATNHLGHFALTGLLIGELASVEGSRIVNVSSLAHRQGKIDFDNLNAERKYSKTAAYSQSKLANLLFSLELERRLRGKGAKTIAVSAHPGWTVTNLQVNTKIFTFLNPFFGQDAAHGALPSLYAATAPGVKGGDYFGPRGFLELKGSPRKVESIPAAQNQETANRLWEMSEELTRVSFLR